MRLRFVAPLIAVLVLAVLLLHNLQQEFGRGSAAHFKVGVIVPLTGSLGDYGMAIYNSIELAKRDRPEVFDRVQFIFEDVQYDTKSAISAFHNLRQLQKIDLVYVWGVTFCKALAPLAEAVRLPMVGQCIDQEAASGRHFILRFMNYSSEYMLVQAEYLKQRGLNRIGIILADNSYLEEMYTALVENLLPGQRLEIIERIPITDMDLRTPISKAKFVEYDAVGVFLGPGQISQFYRQAREQSLSTPTFGTNFFESLSEVKAASGTMEGAVFVNNIVNAEFADRYRQAFGDESQLAFGGPAYEFALVIAELFGSSKTNLPARDVIERIAALPERQGIAAGPYRFANVAGVGRYFRFPLAVKKIQGSEFVPVK